MMMDQSTMENEKMASNMVSSEKKESESLGRGVVKLPDGSAYDGEWKDGEQNGKFEDARE